MLSARFRKVFIISRLSINYIIMVRFMVNIEISQENYDKLEGIRQRTEFGRRMWRPQNKEWDDVSVTIDDVLFDLTYGKY